MAMGFKHFIFALLAGLALILAVHAQDQPAGFINIACGLAANTSFTYTYGHTDLNNISDATFIDTGTSMSVSPEIKSAYSQYIWNLRSFSQGIRNCYTINVAAGAKYLIRATFLYGNYDGQDNSPLFDLYLGPNMWDTIQVNDSSSGSYKELIHHYKKLAYQGRP